MGNLSRASYLLHMVTPRDQVIKFVFHICWYCLLGIDAGHMTHFNEKIVHIFCIDGDDDLHYFG